MVDLSYIPEQIFMPPCMHVTIYIKHRFSAEERAKRPQLAHMPFGWGPRNCIGMRLALMVAKLTFIKILRHYTLLTSPDTEV